MSTQFKFSGLALMSAALIAAAPFSAMAQRTDTAQFQVTANVLAFCQIDANNLAFGDIQLQNDAPTNAQSNLNVSCTRTTPYTVALSAGANAEGNDVTNRAMVATVGGTTERLGYQLYLDAARSNVWGDGSGTNSSVKTGTGAGLLLAQPQTLVVYGQVAGEQDVPPGNYTDTVTATVTY